MYTKINELRRERAEIYEEMKALLDRAEAEDRDLTAEEQEAYDRMEQRFDEITRRVERLERNYERERDLDASVQEPNRPEPDVRFDRTGRADVLDSEEYRAAFWRAARFGRNILDPPEARALQVGTDTEGGYLVPTEFHRQLFQALEDANIMRTLCKVVQASSGSGEIPVVSAHGQAYWTAEEASYTESDETFGQVTLSAYKATCLIKVSEELLQDSAFDLAAYIAAEFGRRVGALEEAAFVNGDGSGKPTGIVGSAGVGVTAASASAITADEIIDLYHSLGRAYRRRANWLLADSTAKAIRKLKDGNSQYLWQPGMRMGEPDILFGRPVQVSDNVPAIAASAKVIVFADFSYYWIVDRARMALQRLSELYAETGQVGFRAFKRVDGKLTLSAAAKVLQMAA